MSKDKHRMSEDVGLHQDLEWAKREEQKAKIDKQNYKKMLSMVTERSNILVWEAVHEVDNTYHISDIIGPTKNLLGYDKNDLRGKNIEEVMSKRSYQSFISNINRKNSDSINIDMVLKNSKTKISFNTIFIVSRKDNEVWKVFCISTMVVDLIKTIYEDILENLNYAIVVLHKDQIFYLNKAARSNFKEDTPVCFSELLEFIDPEMRGTALNEFLNIKKGKKIGVKQFKLYKRKEFASINFIKIDDEKLVLSIRLIKP
jgi:hypothetical protein